MIKKNTTDIKNLEIFYTQNFSEEDIDTLCDTIAKSLIEVYFIHAIISNETYEKEIFKIVKKLIIKYLSSSQKSVEFNIALSIYIFKKQFKLIFEYLSQYLMREVAYSNHGVIDFLKYYSLDIILVDAVKYKVPQIKEEDGPVWNVTSMLSILKTYIKTHKQLEDVDKEIKSLLIRIKSCHIDGLTPIEFNQIIEKKYHNLEQKMQENSSRISILHDSLIISKDEEEIHETNKELKTYQDLRMELREERAVLIKAKIKQMKMFEYEELINRLDLIQKESKAKYKILEQHQDSYTSIKNALMKALISKKQAI